MDRQPSDRSTARAAALASELRSVIGKLKRRWREQANIGDFTSSQLSVLSRLEREGSATVTRLARAEGMRPQSMGAIVSALEEAGIISGKPDPSDGRQTVLSLTPAFQKKVKARRTATEDWLVNILQTKLTAAEQEDLANGVELLKRLVDP